MIIGVAAVIAMVALGTGARQMIEDQVKTAGTNLVTVMAGSANTGGVRSGAGGNVRLCPRTPRCCAICRRSSTWRRASARGCS
jgi:putative ABC transport system permease protein